MQTIPSNFLKQLDLKKEILYDGENCILCRKNEIGPYIALFIL